MKKSVIAGIIVLMAGSTAGAGFGDLFGGSNTGNAAIVQLSGTISPTSSGFGTSGITPSNVRDINQKVRNGDYDAVIYEINSGGGAVVASKEIKRSIESLDIPTVCRFRDISASGAYLIATGCDRIVADSATLTGSIGVTSSYLEVSGALEKYGIEYVNISAGKYKEIGSQYSNASEEEKQILKDMAVDIQDEFIQTVDNNRNLSQDEISKVETARVFLGEEAKNLSLVDSLGGRETALRSAEDMTDKDLELRQVETTRSTSLLSLFLSNTGVGSFMSSIGLGFNSGVDTPIRAQY